MTYNKIFRSLFILFAFTALVSCEIGASLEDDEAELPSSLLATYSGTLNYTDSDGNDISKTDGTATISKSGSTYTINFNHNVPTISNLRFKDKNGSYATVSTSNSSAGIVIENDEITVSVVKDGNNWGFTGMK